MEETVKLEEKIRNGWELSAKDYSKLLVQHDFVMPGRGVWTDLILEKAPREGTLNILDAGTGPGVFAAILTLAGHNVTAIDISPKMLEEAKANAAAHGVSPKFLLMNSQEITFAENTFDLIVSRYVVWALEYPEKVYTDWLRVLKPGGRVIVFDGGHPKLLPGEVPSAPDEDRAKAYAETFGEAPPMSFTKENYEEARGWKRELKLTYEARPEWDIDTMQELGYGNVQCENVSERAWYTERQKFMNAGNVFFRLCGDKRL